mmetsp:Transcript_5568/g.13242  ORF Transcript_5568/g.13242 Transcript_5568/m.13242 type:complete len:176 (+) Transcript_5568:1996-2523(+)
MILSQSRASLVSNVKCKAWQYETIGVNKSSNADKPQSTSIAPRNRKEEVDRKGSAVFSTVSMLRTDSVALDDVFGRLIKNPDAVTTFHDSGSSRSRDSLAGSGTKKRNSKSKSEQGKSSISSTLTRFSESALLIVWEYGHDGKQSAPSWSTPDSTWRSLHSISFILETKFSKEVS